MVNVVTDILDKLVPAPRPELPQVFVDSPELEGEVRGFVSDAVAENTRRAKASDWKVFTAWCDARHLPSLPAEPATIAAFLADQATGSPGRKPRAVATVLRYASTVCSIHRVQGHDVGTHPVIHATLVGIQKARGVRQDKKTPLTVDNLGRALPAASSRDAIRDRAIILFGLATACRRSEIVGLDLADVRWVEQGAIVTIRRSKTDQLGEGKQVALPRIERVEICPARGLEAWLKVRGDAPGPLFLAFWKGGGLKSTRMAGSTVATVVKQAARRAGLDADAFAAHSLRAGYVTSARERGMPWAVIMEQTGHKTLEVAKGYSHYTDGVFDATQAGDVFGDRPKK